MLLKSISVDIDGDIIGVDDSIDERKILRNEITMLFSDKDSSDIEFELIFTWVVVLIEIIGNSVRNVENSGEDDLSFGVEVDPVHRRIWLFTDAFVEIDVIFIINIVFLS